MVVAQMTGWVWRASGLLVTLAMFALACCAQAPAEPAQPTVIIYTRTRAVAFHVDVASTPQTRAVGLMFRDRLEPDEGMLFVFEQPARQQFWMKNTRIALDMVFVGADRRVLGAVERAEPATEALRGLDGPSQYVLELNAGTYARLGIHAGDRVVFRDVGVP